MKTKKIDEETQSLPCITSLCCYWSVSL